MSLKDINIFGIRHLSPRTAYHLLNDLKEKKPKAILIEGPEDCSFLIKSIISENVKPPFAILSYTEAEPIESIMYPFGDYSPEYIGMKYALENNIYTKFIDMPASYFFIKGDDKEEKGELDIYYEISKKSGFDDYESFWESYFEHNEEKSDFIGSIKELGKNLREIEKVNDFNLKRENHMVREIMKAKRDGYDFKDIYVICGAYHVEGILNGNPKENLLKGIKGPKVKHTLMPYSNYKLSSYSGYGSGNKAPSYFGDMFKYMMEEREDEFPISYITKVARSIRENGGFASPASVIEAASLGNTLANLRGNEKPNLKDLKDAIISTLGEGEVTGLVDSMAEVEVGNIYGSVINNENLTPIQQDFNKRIKEFRLSKHLSGEEGSIKLDLREERGKAKSYFLHKLEILNIGFSKEIKKYQERGSFREEWALKYSPDCEIKIVEAIIKGTTINDAVITKFLEEVKDNKTLDSVLDILKKALLCGEEKIIRICRDIIEELSIEELDFIKLAKTCETLAFVIKYGDVRSINPKEYYPLLEKVYFKGTNAIINQCNVNEEKAREINYYIEELKTIGEDFSDILERERLNKALKIVYENSNNSPMILGYLLNILLREERIEEEELKGKISAYFSYGMDMEKAALWLQGLCYKNVAILCNKEYLWLSLDSYIKNLDKDNFKKILVSLRKALVSFSSNEKIKIGEILGDSWGVNSTKTAVNMIATKVNINEFDLEGFKVLEEYDFGEF